LHKITCNDRKQEFHLKEYHQKLSNSFGNFFLFGASFEFFEKSSFTLYSLNFIEQIILFVDFARITIGMRQGVENYGFGGIGEGGGGIKYMSMYHVKVSSAK
jgi:hypothetical protein